MTYFNSLEELVSQYSSFGLCSCFLSGSKYKQPLASPDVHSFRNGASRMCRNIVQSAYLVPENSRHNFTLFVFDMLVCSK